jgi:hypothetical protein
MRQLYVGLLGLLGWLWPFVAQATHLVGGHLEMRAVGDVPGHFRIAVTHYFENNNRANQTSNGVMGIFRKRDNALMTSFTARETAALPRSPIIFANTYCASQRSLNFLTATFIADVQLPPGQYTDAQGYYISYLTRNRNGGINNISDPLGTGYTFYLEFPPLSTTGKYLNNSSPVFGPINGEYVCLNEPFTYPFGGTDPDGDELRYSLITPLNHKNGNGNGGNANIVAPAPYPNINFSGGFSATNAIPGNPALRVDAASGQLSVTASQLGLFVFAVLVEEYRNGQKIGEVRRDFQLLVVDCPPVKTPEPVSQIKGLAITVAKTTLCPGESATLIVTEDPTWNYQWQRDQTNLSGATSSTLLVRDEGVYTVQVSLKNACTKASDAQSLTIHSMNTTPTLTALGQLCAADGEVLLRASGVPDCSFEWLANGQPVAGATTDMLTIAQPGTYQARLTHRTLGCTVLSEKRTLSRAPAVQATLKTATGYARLPRRGPRPAGRRRYPVRMGRKRAAHQRPNHHYAHHPANGYVQRDRHRCQRLHGRVGPAHADQRTPGTAYACHRTAVLWHRSRTLYAAGQPR